MNRYSEIDGGLASDECQGSSTWPAVTAYAFSLAVKCTRPDFSGGHFALTHLLEVHNVVS
jgi:hypothetical protein